MTIGLWIIFLFLIFQRLVELVIARSNEKWMIQRGAIETGESHYKWFVITHCFFFVFILFEVFINSEKIALSPLLFIIFLSTQIFRVWCIASLGRYWNTKIIVLPGANLIRKGPYSFLKHPNYLIVGIELFVIPLMFQAYITSILFPILHLLLLYIRIPKEEQALLELNTNNE
ncbi:hypothetical protein GH741_07135 [Aquibacillus halophilus]|uniref:Isoprenylcysteine carboxyl methyltransferase n=1 Tax=Aquibacillus halophilus TaxID=930132 RepID=A0A6A8DD49_9BACI|nr:isoprenylcysteine carboxylmethyltransferase family protein [Aquibacillus halophilus]MRH42456.1 hypothetical protein [Aquibacillus halophilus]